MNSTTDTAPSTASKSLVVARAIAAICPGALFCTFGVSTKAGRQVKMPFSKAGAGVSGTTPPEDLYSADDILRFPHNPQIPPGRGEYWGVVMHQPTYDPFGDLVLTIVDVDTKSSTAPRDIRLTKLSQWARDNNHLRELSHSRKGIHVIFLAKADEEVFGKYDLGNSQAVEVFGQSKSPRKSVMLTGDELTATEVHHDVVDLKAVLDSINIEPPPPEPAQEAVQPYQAPDPTDAPMAPGLDDYSRSIDAIRYLDPDMEHDDWVMVGMALKDGLQEQGYAIWLSWSTQGSKFVSEAECKVKWRSFKKSGVKINTLFGMAQRAGWKNPRKGLPKQRTSAHDEFAQYIRPANSGEAHDQGIANTGEPHDQSIDPDTGEILEAPKGWPELDYSLQKLPAIDYLIEGFFAHSFSVFAGQPGVGKTTAVISLALIVAGFTIPGSDCSSKSRRKVIYVSEDSSQIVRSLYGYCKIFNFDQKEISEWLILIDSKRSDVDEVLRLAHNVVRHTINNERPWLVIDTANATLDIENENDNSEVGKYIAAMKQLIYTKLHTPVTIITHTSKTSGRGDDAALARGASAFTGDATLTGAIFLDTDEERYFRLTKHRYEPEFKEVRFETQFHEAVVIDRHGDPQSQRCIVVTPVSSSQNARQAAREEAQNAEQQARVTDVLDRVTLYVRDLINRMPQGVCMRKGRLPKNAPVHMQAMHKLSMEEIRGAVEGSSSNDVRSRLAWKIIHEFAPQAEASDNLWVQLV